MKTKLVRVESDNDLSLEVSQDFEDKDGVNLAIQNGPGEENRCEIYLDYEELEQVFSVFGVRLDVP